MVGNFQKGNTRSSKLTPTQVHEIRQLYAQGWSQGRLCRQYDISIGQIGRIVRGESWKQYRQVPTQQEEQHIDYIERIVNEEPPSPELQAKIDADMKKMIEKEGLK